MATIRLCSQCLEPLPENAPEGLCPQCLAKAAFESTAKPSDAPKPPTPPELAQDFPQLEIIELLGQGGMGIVYKARQTRLDRLVALKLLPAYLGADRSFAERFMREAKALARLNHTGIVTVYDFGQTQRYYYLLMEFVEGMNLRQLLRTQNPTPREALEIVMQICGALQFAHDEGIVHRDIKPENILINKKGQVKIADFGLAKLVGKAMDTSLTMNQAVMGTLNYMAPEQRENSKQVDHRADIYSLGVVFYELLTGQIPLGRFDPPSKKVQVDVRLDEVVLRALEREPERRYQHASEIRTGVELIAATISKQRPESNPTKIAPEPPPGFAAFVLPRFALFVVAWLSAVVELYLISGRAPLKFNSVFPIEIIAAPNLLRWGGWLLPLGLAIISCTWMEAKSARGLRLGDLPPEIRKRITRHTSLAAAVVTAAGALVVVATMVFGAMRTSETRELRFVPNKQEFESVGLKARFNRFEQRGRTYYEAPPACEVAVIMHRTEKDASTMKVTLPGLRAEFLTTNGVISSVLDKETFQRWLQQEGGLHSSLPGFETDSTELYHLLKAFENVAPQTSEAFLASAKAELRDFWFAGFSSDANFQSTAWPFAGGTWAWTVLWAVGLLCVFYTVRTVGKWYQVAWNEIVAGRWSPPKQIGHPPPFNILEALWFLIGLSWFVVVAFVLANRGFYVTAAIVSVAGLGIALFWIRTLYERRRFSQTKPMT